MDTLPFSFVLPTPDLIPTHYDNHIQRKLSGLKGLFLDQKAYEELLSKGDVLLYEVYEILRPQHAGELLSGISIIHPGKVGNEFFMTKGHFHAVLDTAEIYLCMKGEGFMVMENPEGEWEVESLAPGIVLYVPPQWAHRSVCTSRQEDLVTFFIYPGHSGHDYGTIEQKGFRKLVVDGVDGIEIIDNPRWIP
jgi:glucose-6-phosphate isomerase, archaeal